MSQVIDLFTRQPIPDEPESEDKPFDIVEFVNDWGRLMVNVAQECQGGQR